MSRRAPASLAAAALITLCGCHDLPAPRAAPSPALASEQIKKMAPEVARFVHTHRSLCLGQRPATDAPLQRAERLLHGLRVQEPLLLLRPEAAALARRMRDLLEACTRIAQARAREQPLPLGAWLQWRGVTRNDSAGELQNWTLQQIAQQRSAWLAASGPADLRSVDPLIISRDPIMATAQRSRRLRQRLDHLLRSGDAAAAWRSELRSSCVVDGLRLFAPSLLDLSASDSRAHMDRRVWNLDAAARAAADLQLHGLAHSAARAKEILRGHSLLDDTALAQAMTGLQTKPLAALAAQVCLDELRRFDQRWRQQGLSLQQRRALFDGALARSVWDQQGLREALVAIERELREREPRLHNHQR